MAIDAMSPDRPATFAITRPVELVCFALCVAQAVYLVAAFIQGSWLIDVHGELIATDFVNVWSAGRQVIEGHAAAVYDVTTHTDAEATALKHPFVGEYPWIYPPTFLFVSAALALLPYLAAYAAWIVATFAAYAATVRSIIGNRVGLFLACAYPGILSNLVVGQNGFLTAALFGGALLALERRPLVAGCLFGLLSFKPHLGVLVPLVLLVDRRWTAIGAAGAVTALLAASSWLAFGTASWEAFFHAMQAASQAALADGRADWAKLQSIFGVVRLLGCSESLAWIAQAVVTGATAILLCVLWRSQVSFDLKAAALVTGALIATPYIFLYDLVALAVPMAFILCAGAQTEFLPGEMPAIAVACLLILVFPVVTAPVGLGAMLIVALVIARRALHHGGASESPQAG
jgi:arabinofuranan 3-O-arabinosyltransferase